MVFVPARSARSSTISARQARITLTCASVTRRGRPTVLLPLCTIRRGTRTGIVLVPNQPERGAEHAILALTSAVHIGTE